MALEVNSQNLFQNAQFQQFVDFAEAAAKAGKQKAVARVDAGELGGIVNRTITAAKGDWVGNVGRLHQPRRQRGPGHRRRAGRADGEEVVRPLTAEDVDTIGKACLFNSVNI